MEEKEREKKERKVCPLLMGKETCKKCAWYDGFIGECIVFTLVSEIRGIGNRLSQIERKIK